MKLVTLSLSFHKLRILIMVQWVGFRKHNGSSANQAIVTLIAPEDPQKWSSNTKWLRFT
ncbi:hypothetical protein GIB67_015111 [Kingdonia uniflora]|uniref:Uncharacterized protein n=1 Tax=Kingdonia uniflora TaxID=39325 RepID=A0A7J7LIY9_9MAGN|nr:hypothetical protein GIB67_015111 [Kingdonia uniflora]